MKKSKDENKDKSNFNGSNNRIDSNIFYIIDGIIDQLNKTKKLFIIMILTIMIIPPIAFIASFVLIGFPFHNDGDNGTQDKPWWWGSAGPDGSHSESNPFISFRFLPFIPIIVVIVWLGIGIRQWFILSKWDKKYKKYKDLQKRIEEELEKDDINDDKIK